MLLLGYSLDDDWYSPSFATKAESIPGFFIIKREIKKAISGKDFFYNDRETGKPIRCDGINNEDFFYYYKLWEDFHFLKILPEGKGTSSERRWYLDFIILFEKTHGEIENFVQVQATKN